MAHDLVIRNGIVVDGTGAEPVAADVAIDGERITAVGRDVGKGTREIDATDRYVTPGFVDIHTHLDAQIAWDPTGSSSCWHGITSAVLGNCGVTFAPVRPNDREYLAEIMESVEDIPAESIMAGLPWDWESYGDYLDSLERMAKGFNLGGMVGHAALRYHAMGERSLDEDSPPTVAELNTMCGQVDEAMAAGALGFSTSRTLLHRVPDGRPVPGTWAERDELMAIAEVLGKRGRGVFEVAPRFERDAAPYPKCRAEIDWMVDISIETGRPVTYGIAYSDAKPDLWKQVIDFTDEGNARGGRVRPQSTTRGIGVLFGINNRTPFDKNPEWRKLRELDLEGRLAVVRDPDRRAALIAEADAGGPGAAELEKFYVITGPHVDYEPDPARSLPAVAAARGVGVAEAFLDLALETNGEAVLNYPFLNSDLDAVKQLMHDPNVVIGLADSGAHVGQIMDASQPTWILSNWVRDKAELTIEEAVRRITSDTAGLFGIADRGVVAEGAFADLNVIDLDGMMLPPPEYVRDFPAGAGRYVQKSVGYDYTLVNGEVFMEGLDHTGSLSGRVLRSGPDER